MHARSSTPAGARNKTMSGTRAWWKPFWLGFEWIDPLVEMGAKPHEFSRDSARGLAQIIPPAFELEKAVDPGVRFWASQRPANQGGSTP